MKLLPLSDYADPIPSLASQLEDLERQLGKPSAPADLEERVVHIAHELRNQLTMHHLLRHLNGLPCVV